MNSNSTSSRLQTILFGNLITLCGLFCPNLAGGQTAPIDYRFSRYPDSTYFRNIYLGRFEAVWTLPEKQALKKEPFAEMMWALKLKQLFFANHAVFSKDFAASEKKSALRNYDMVFDRVILENGFEIAREKKAVEKHYQLRVKYYDTFVDVMKTVETAVANTNSDRYTNDVNTLFDQVSAFMHREGIASAVVKQFEENLQRAVNKQLAFQTTLPGIQKIPLFAIGWRSTAIGKKFPENDVCICVYNVLEKQLGKTEVWNLEDDFTQEKFLYLAISNTTLMPQLWDCLHRQ